MIKRAPSYRLNVSYTFRSQCAAFSRLSSTQQKTSSVPKQESSQKEKEDINSLKSSQQKSTSRKKTQAELDQELQLKMAGLAGDGGEAGLELEDGKAVGMKRSVRENMFRYI